jgi:hypothetical protein
VIKLDKDYFKYLNKVKKECETAAAEDAHWAQLFFEKTAKAYYYWEQEQQGNPNPATENQKNTLRKLQGEDKLSGDVDIDKLSFDEAHGLLDKLIGSKQPSVDKKKEKKKSSDGGNLNTACSECGETVLNAGGHEAEQIIWYSNKEYGRTICLDCQTKL